MKTANQALSQTTQQTKPSTENTLTYAHSDECFDYVWRGLQAARLLTKDMVIDGTDYRYWKHQLADMNDNHLKAGFENSGTFHGFFTWAEFRKLCIEGYNQKVEQHRREPTTPRLSDLRTLGGNQRTKELMKVTQVLLAEGPDGPVTRATRDKVLTARFVRGKSADEIISHCKKLYGE